MDGSGIFTPDSRGPGTGEHYARLQKSFTDLTTAMLAEPADLIESLTNTAAQESADVE